MARRVVALTGSALLAAALLTVPVLHRNSSVIEPRATLTAATSDVYGPGPSSSPTPTPSITPSPTPSLTSSAPPTAGTLKPGKVQKAVRRFLTGTPLGPHVRVDIAGLTGPSVYDWGTGAATPASTTKLLTSAAALHYYGATHRFATTAWVDPVTTAAVPTLVLKGGGDPLLTRYQAPPDPPKPALAGVERLAKIAAQRLASEGYTRVRLRFDNSYFTGPTRPAQWRVQYDGFMSQILPLWLDEGRTRGLYVQAHPALIAAQTFATALHQAGIKTLGPITQAKLQDGASEVGSVSSGQLSGLINWMLHWSDNAVAEILGHQDGAAIGDPSFTGGVTAVKQALRAMHIPVAGVRLYDGSGLSRDDRIPPETLVSVLQHVAQPGSPLASIKTGLPIAGVSGTLADKFTDPGDPAKGVAMAKTGSLTGVATLAGYTVDADGTPIVFALMADKTPSYATAEVWEDKIVSSLTACHCG